MASFIMHILQMGKLSLAVVKKLANYSYSE